MAVAISCATSGAKARNPSPPAGLGPLSGALAVATRRGVCGDAEACSPWPDRRTFETPAIGEEELACRRAGNIDIVRNASTPGCSLRRAGRRGINEVFDRLGL
jgi:hypothetical protein